MEGRDYSLERLREEGRVVYNVCVCVCVRERERERDCVCVYLLEGGGGEGVAKLFC